MNEQEYRLSDENITPYEAVTTSIEGNEQQIVMTSVEGRHVPEFKTQLRNRIVEVPHEIYQATGIRVFGKRIKSLLFSTDLAIIRNSNAQSVMAVYPFSPQAVIMQSIIHCASVPVFVGVGGGTTTGMRSVNLAFQGEQMGAYGVVVNAPMSNDVIRDIKRNVDVPVIATVSSFHDDFVGKLEAGADMLNVSGGARTVELVKHIRDTVGYSVPIIATGGPTGESIKQTIQAGANAITYTPPTSAEIFASLMKKYRKDE